MSPPRSMISVVAEFNLQSMCETTRENNEEKVAGQKKALAI